MKIKGSVALVTGANGGIGQAFVRELLKRGAKKIYLGARDPASLQGLFGESSQLVPIALDVTNAKQIEEQNLYSLRVQTLDGSGVGRALSAIHADAERPVGSEPQN